MYKLSRTPTRASFDSSNKKWRVISLDLHFTSDSLDARRFKREGESHPLECNIDRPPIETSYSRRTFLFLFFTSLFFTFPFSLFLSERCPVVVEPRHKKRTKLINPSLGFERALLPSPPLFDVAIRRLINPSSSVITFPRLSDSHHQREFSKRPPSRPSWMKVAEIMARIRWVDRWIFTA